MYYIDIHNHMLTGIDDGARNPETTAKMLQIAYDDGIREIICTPHYLPGTYETGKAERELRVSHLLGVTAKFFPGLRIWEGCEYYAAFGNLTEHLRRGGCGTLANSKYMLVEFSPETPGDVMERQLLDIVSSGFWPIVAHAERYTAFENEDYRFHIASFGYLQLNADSINGDYGTRIKRLARKMLSEDIVTFVATDAHGAHHRKPVLSVCAEYLETHFGTEYVEKLLYRNPKCIIDNVRI